MENYLPLFMEKYLPFTAGCYHERNRYMVDNSSKLICYYDGSGGGTGYTVEYVKKRSIQIVNLCTSFSSHNPNVFSFFK